MKVLQFSLHLTRLEGALRIVHLARFFIGSTFKMSTENNESSNISNTHSRASPTQENPALTGDTQSPTHTV